MAFADTYRPQRGRNLKQLHAMEMAEFEEGDIREIQRKADERLRRAGIGRTIGGLLGAVAAAAIVIGTGGLALAAAPAIMGASIGAGTAIGGGIGTAVSGKGGQNRAVGVNVKSELGIDAKYEVDETVEDIRKSKVLEDAWRNAKLAYAVTGLGQGYAGGAETNVSTTGGTANVSTGTATSPTGPSGGPSGGALPPTHPARGGSSIWKKIWKDLGTGAKKAKKLSYGGAGISGMDTLLTKDSGVDVSGYSSQSNARNLQNREFITAWGNYLAKAKINKSQGPRMTKQQFYNQWASQ